MPGAFSGISMAGNALRFFQRALETAGHNIANVNTPGYSRQTVEFKTSVPLTIYSGGFKAMGSGVTISAIERARDSYLEASARDNNGSLGRFQTLSAALRQIESSFIEPGDEGIAASLDKLFDAWSALGSNPSADAARIQVQSAGSLVSSRIRGAYSRLSSQAAQVTTSINGTIDRINELGLEIDTLNQRIREFAATQGSANDLMDSRDVAVRELSGLIDTKVETFPDGSYAVYTAGLPLVDSVGSRTIPKTFDTTAGTFDAAGVTWTVRSGSLSGLFQASAAVTTQQTQLDSLANELRTQFNALHQTGIDADGNTGNDFFNVALNGAIDFDLSTEVKASARAIAAGTTGNAGDGGLALALGQMRDTTIVALGDLTFHGFYQGNVAQVASQAAFYQVAGDTEQAVANQIRSQVEAVSGVSLDDEMADMMRYQRSYQAAARALMVFDQVTEDLIAMLRR